MKEFFSFDRRVLLSCLPAAAFALLPETAAAQVELRFATGQAPDSLVMQRLYGPWYQAINKEGAGAVKITPFPPPFATATNMWDRVTAGVANIGVIALYNTGLPLGPSMVTVLPNLGRNSEAASVALWRLYKRGLLDKRLDEVHVLGFQTPPYLTFQSRKPITSLEQISGMRVRVTDATTAAGITALGGAPTSIPFNEAYQAISRGVVDAALSNVLNLVVFRFRELFSHDVSNVSFGMAPFIFAMNRDAYAALTPEARAAIDAWSGERLSRFMGVAFDKMSEDFYAELKKTGELTRHELPEAEQARWREKLDAVTQAWIKATPNGQAVYDAYIEEYKKVLEGK